MKPGRGGFTMLEVMIAVAFIGIALVSVIRTQTQGVRLAEESRFTARAVFLAQYLLADAQVQTEITPGIQEDAFKAPLEDLRWQREITPLPFLQGLYKIQVWVYRAGRPASEGLTLRGFIYREQQ
ncbi:MAG: prepilin-type N-terminal cleavage/methylation domain-containing protein [Pseudomonadota bacterium]